MAARSVTATAPRASGARAQAAKQPHRVVHPPRPRAIGEPPPVPTGPTTLQTARDDLRAARVYATDARHVCRTGGPRRQVLCPHPGQGLLRHRAPGQRGGGDPGRRRGRPGRRRPGRGPAPPRCDRRLRQPDPREGHAHVRLPGGQGQGAAHRGAGAGALGRGGLPGRGPGPAVRCPGGVPEGDRPGQHGVAQGRRPAAPRGPGLLHRAAGDRTLHPARVRAEGPLRPHRGRAGVPEAGARGPGTAGRRLLREDQQDEGPRRGGLRDGDRGREAGPGPGPGGDGRGEGRTRRRGGDDPGPGDADVHDQGADRRRAPGREDRPGAGPGGGDRGGRPGHAAGRPGAGAGG